MLEHKCYPSPTTATIAITTSCSRNSSLSPLFSLHLLLLLIVLLQLCSPTQSIVYRTFLYDTTLVLQPRSNFAMVPFDYSPFNYLVLSGLQDFANSTYTLNLITLIEVLYPTTFYQIFTQWELKMTVTKLFQNSFLDVAPDLKSNRALYFKAGSNTGAHAFSIGGSQRGNFMNKSYDVFAVSNGVSSTLNSNSYGLNFDYEGHSVVLSTSNTDLFPWGRFLIFGGRKSTGVYSSDILVFSLNTTGAPISLPTILALNPSLPKPPARAYHSAIILKGVDHMYIFGGYNSTTYLDDLWLFDTTSWIQLQPSTPGPSARAGHSVLWGQKLSSTQTVVNDESGFYLHGGTDGTTVFNDLWYYDISGNKWSQVTTDGGQPEPPPRAYHAAVNYYSMERQASLLLFFGGIDQTNKALNTWTILELGTSCDYYCQVGDVSFCTTLSTCLKYHFCDWNSDTRFSCNFQCTNTLRPCSTLRPCPNVTCWDGECATSIDSCNPIPYCSPFQRRCHDGTCQSAATATSCRSVTCTPPLTLCADGSCKSQCPKYYGCLPNSKPYLCPDGTCVSSISACRNFSDCNSTYSSCANGCALTCTLPNFLLPASRGAAEYQIAPNSTQQQLIHFPIGGSKIFNPKACVVAQTSVAGKTLHLSLRWEPVDTSELATVGPLPTWTEEFNTTFFVSVIFKLNTSGVQELLSYYGSVYLFFDFNPYYGQPDTPDTSRFCFATVVPWYWDDDNDIEGSDLESVPYIKAHIDNPKSTNITTPAYRWKCISGGGWPRPASFSTVTFYGAQLQKDCNYSTFAIIKKSDKVVTPTPPAEFPPKDDNAHNAVLGVASFILFIVSLVVLIKALQKK